MKPQPAAACTSTKPLKIPAWTQRDWITRGHPKRHSKVRPETSFTAVSATAIGRITSALSLASTSSPQKTRLASNRPQVTRCSNCQMQHVEPSSVRQTDMAVATRPPNASMCGLNAKMASDTSPPTGPKIRREHKNTSSPVAAPISTIMARHCRSRDSGRLPHWKKNS